MNKLLSSTLAILLEPLATLILLLASGMVSRWSKTLRTGADGLFYPARGYICNARSEDSSTALLPTADQHSRVVLRQSE